MRAPSQPELYRPRLTYPDIPYGAMLDRPVTLYPEREAIAFKDASITLSWRGWSTPSPTRCGRSASAGAIGCACS
jgi:hypothetical protein